MSASAAKADALARADDESKQTTIFDLPDDIIHNNITKYLLEDKQTNKIFSKKDDYYLLNFLCGKFGMSNISYLMHGMIIKQILI